MRRRNRQLRESEGGRMDRMEEPVGGGGGRRRRGGGVLEEICSV